MKKFLFSIATVLMCAGLPILTSCGNNKTATEQTDGTDDAVAEGRERVQKTLEQFSSQLPQPMGAGISLTGLAIEGDYVVYTIEIADADTFNAIEINEESKQMGLQNIGAQGKTFIDANLGAKFKYTNKDSKESKEFSITPEELEANYNANTK
ncbi:hypothetical protein [Duncaniella freteri]|uniref:hypothetical protein n=1 Tax=Duncaniella freteri TaxID=2530391 RepID=UPI0025575C95|nr:hypothetical protein [Duncaniella freteri]